MLGLAHWIQGGDQSLESLLQQEGYTLQRVDGVYAADRFPDIPTDTCLVDADLAEALTAASSAKTLTYGTCVFLLAFVIVFM